VQISLRPFQIRFFITGQKQEARGSNGYNVAMPKLTVGYTLRVDERAIAAAVVGNFVGQIARFRSSERTVLP
jgi:hypothetical protein